MKVLELLDELEEILDTASGVPLTKKIILDGLEIQDIVREIRVALPEEIQQAHWITEQRQGILEEGKKEYDIIIQDAKQQAEILVDTSEIMMRAKAAAKDLTAQTEANVKQLKLDTYDYIDKILFEFQNKMEQLNATYFGDMFTNIQRTFEGINRTVQENRVEIKDLAYKTHMEGEG
ncbi:MAG: ATPase [Clostridiales Family XIII bacterium]|nr:ATPase [Clostridiales Family XIII bacterium]